MFFLILQFISVLKYAKRGKMPHLLKTAGWVSERDSKTKRESAEKDPFDLQ